MRSLYFYQKPFIAAVFASVSLFVTGCSGGGAGAIDKLFGGSSAPILTSVPDQIVAQEDALSIDINNIKEGTPGTDEDMSYTCVFDQIPDGSVDAGTPCATLPGTSVLFGASTGILLWTPSTSVLGNYEFKVTGMSDGETYAETFTIGVRLKFNGVGLYSNITGTSVTANWTPNTAATSYQIFKLNTLTGQYEVFRTVANGASSGTVITGLTPNSPYTLRVQALDNLGNLDGNVVSRSFTTTELVKFSMTPATGTVAAGTALPITIQAFNANGTPQTVGGLPITPQIASGTSSGNFSTVTDNNDGTYSLTFTPTTVGSAISIDLTTNTTFFLNNTVDLTIVPGPANSANSAISISSNNVISGQAVTVSGTVRDAYNNPISTGSTILFTKTGGTSTGTFSAVTNQGNGNYSATYTGIVAGTAQTLAISVNGTALTPTTTIQVLPGTPVSAHSTLTIASASISSGTSTLVTATLRDINSNPVPTGILVAFNKSGGTSSGSFSAVVNAGAGAYTTTYTGLTAGTAQTLSVSVDGVTLAPTVTVTVVPGAPFLANSSLTISANTIVSGNFVTATATLKDVNNNPIESGITVSFTKTGGTSTGTFGAVTNQGAGVYNIRYTGVVAGTDQTIRVLINGVDLGPTVLINVTPGAPVAGNSTIATSGATVVSGNQVTITATLRDTNNNPVPSGILVAFSKTGGTSTGNFGSVTNAGAGVYTITYEGIASGSAQTIGVLVDSSALGISTSVTVLTGAPLLANSSLVISANTVTSTNYVTATATLRDVNNNPISSGSTISFTKTGGTSTGAFAAVVNEGNGVYTVRYTGIVAGTDQTIRVLVNGVDLGPTVLVNVTPGAPSSTNSTITVATATVLSGASDTVTATIRDANNNTISSGILVTFSKTGGTSTGNFSSVVNQGAGVYQINYEGVVAGTAQTITLIIDGIALGPTTTVQVLPGAPSSLLSTLSLSAGTVISGNSITATATIRDANSNPISAGFVMGFDKIGGTSTGTFGTIVNQGSGVYTVTYTGVIAGTAQTLQANVNGAGFGPVQTVQVLVGAPLAANSILSVTTSPLASGSNATLAALIRDVNNNPITTQYAITFDTVGGSSTGSIGAVNNAGSGNFNALYTGVIAGSAQTVRVLADGTPITGLTSTVQVVPGAVDAANSLFTTSAGTVQSGTTANFTINLRDSNNNAITGATVTFNKTAGVSNGTITGATHTTNGNYPAVYTATTQGTAQTVTLVVNGTAVPALNVSETVTAGPPASVTVAGPANPLNSIDCNGPYTATLKDAASNTTSSLSSLNVALTSVPSVHAGTIFSDASCNTPVNDLTFGIFVSSVQFYYKSYVPYTFDLTLDPDGAITNGLVSIQNIAVPSYIGTASSNTFNGSGSLTVVGDTGTGLWTNYNSTVIGDYLYASDYGANRIIKYNIVTNTLVGWIGHIGSLEGISSGCASNVLGDLTPEWCTGGRSNPAVSTILYQPRGIGFDATYIYVASNNRILRFRQDTGAYAGWIGRVNTIAPPAPGQLATCAGATTATKTPGWCLGGNFNAGSGDGQFNTPTDVVVEGTKFYVSDYSNHRIQKFDLASGAFEGWVGRVATVPTSPPACAAIAIGDNTPTWCVGGTPASANRYNLACCTPETPAPPEGFNGPMALDTDGTYIYIADYSNYRIVRYTMAGVMSGWLGRINRGNSAFNTTSPVAVNGAYTTTWTYGGTTTNGTGSTGYGPVTDVRVDGSDLYFTDAYHRVVRIDKADGQNFYWLGRVSTSPSGGFTGCSSTPISGVTPGWCFGGGANRLGNTNSAFYNPYSIDFKDNTMFVADVTNSRIQKFNKTTGEFAGWIGSGGVQAQKWTRVPAASYARAGIDDYSFGTTDTAWANIAINGTSLFVPDITFHRIKRHNLKDGSIVGYIGQISIFPPVGPETCVGYTSGMTRDWCTGGGRTTNGSGIHGYQNPYGIAADGTYTYVVNNANERIDRVRITDALYMGWIGRVSTTPTDGDPACLTSVNGDITPSWCIGGTAAASNADGGWNSPRGAYYDSLSNRLYVVDSGKLAKINPTTGVSEGIIGHVTAPAGCITGTAANGWCVGGTGGTGANTYGSLNDGTAIAVNTNHLFVVDTATHRLVRYVKSTGAPAGFVGRLQNTTNISATGYCTPIAANSPAPGWCYGTSVGVAITAPSADTVDGTFNSPRGVFANDNYIYVADSLNNRIVRIDAVTGAFAGWKGYIASTAGMSAGACLSAGVGAITPTWCYKGASGPASSLGGFDLPTGLAGDANYLYVQDGRNNRIVTVPLN